ncbi:MAG: hypothetical protein JWM58_980 [Rhizobium sp.]|nr:hypothetical protein [Rhizobium sp.]
MRTKLVIACLSAVAIATMSSSQALAWGCVAVDSEGAYGYSYNWPDEQDAELRALNECDARSNTNDCQTDSCDPNG